MTSASGPAREMTVVAAVIRDPTGRILISRRPEHRHMGGLWEFPGGKVGDGESPATALARELYEELGVAAAVSSPLTSAVHEEPGLRIVLLFYEARITAGEAAARDGQILRWVKPRELPSHAMPPADAALVARLASEDPP